MTEYVCPDHIQKYFETDDENYKFIGRKLAVKWYRSLDAKIFDRIYLPEIGWMEKTRAADN